MGPLGLAELSRQCHHGKPAVLETSHQVVHRRPRRAEHQRGFRLIEAQHVDNRVLAVIGCHAQRAIFNIHMLLGVRCGLNPHRIALVFLRQRRNLARHGGRKHQGAAAFWRLGQDELQILAEAHVQHLIRLIQHHGADVRQVKRVALDMVLQPPRRADHDVSACGKFALFAARIHAADAGNDARIRISIKPCEFAMHL
ncbi:hypothetical protein GALL_514230 [mine drainage metagenome]|uniref:Uncharacterized protein n=1 Tax=mine drainage metagenome TaxID=410659 RepID=A0A1J5PTX3_9ZZZZ